MKIHIDGIIFSLQAHGGISVLFRELITRLPRPGVETIVSVESPLLQSFKLAPDAGGRLLARSARPLERYRPCRGVDRLSRDHIFHSSYYRTPEQQRSRSVVTVHDFAYERTVSGPRKWVHTVQKSRAIRNADVLVCISQATRDDLLEYVGVLPHQQLCVVYNGISEAYHPLDSSTQTSSDPGFFLFVGQRGGYKNFKLAVEVLNKLPDLELICVGGGPLRQDELGGLPQAVRQRIKHLGSVSDMQLNSLYNRAVCLLYPSAYEGFGIPPLEAMRAGCPVVCIACKAVQEVGGDALIVAATDAASIAAAVESAMQSELRQGIRVAGFNRAQLFSWERHVEQMLQIYTSLA